MGSTSALHDPCSQTEDEACLSAMFLTTNQVYPAVLNAAIDLNLFGILANKGSPPGTPMSAAEIAAHLPSNHPDMPDRLDRMLRLLASYTLLTCSSRDNPDHHGGSSTVSVYGLSPVGRYCVPNENGGYLASFTSFLCYEALLKIWYVYLYN